MHKLKNGILYHNNKPVFGVGVSYYPSFYPEKLPVADKEQQVPEMIKDIAEMKSFGINIVRTSALGNVKREDDNIVCDTPFIDSMVEEAEKNDIAMMIRLQGYHMDVSGNENFKMVDAEGNEVKPNKWNAFIHNSLFHKGILKDNEDATKALTKHYSKYDNFISFCVYNEPHYPGGAGFDYHPDTIAAYRQWLVENKVMTDAEAKDYMPPKKRPDSSAEIDLWVKWKMFSMNALSDFLKKSHDYSKEVNPELEGITSAVTTQFLQGNDGSGVDNFSYAQSMDICGYTNYSRVCGNSYYNSALTHDFLESCSAVCGKHTWLLEYDARTDISLKKLEQETYLALGSGVKGIMYYQWRADNPVSTVEGLLKFGFLNNDGSKTDDYEGKKQLVSLLHEYSDYFVSSEKKRSGVAVLHSDYMNLFTCAFQKSPYYVASPYSESMFYIYRDFFNEGVAVDFVKTEHLQENKLGIKCLIVPEYDYMLSDEEKAAIRKFAENGGSVFMYSTGSYNELDRPGVNTLLSEENSGGRVVNDVIKMCGIERLFEVRGSNDLKCKILEGDSFYIMCLNNISSLGKTVKNCSLKLNFNIQNAFAVSLKGKYELQVNNNEILLPEIESGLLVFAEK